MYLYNNLKTDTTTVRPRKFEFPKRLLRPSTLPIASPLQATTTQASNVSLNIEDNHSEEVSFNHCYPLF